MAKGYPDFFGQSIFLSYGSTEEYYVEDINIAVDVWTDIVDIDAKGHIYGGHVYISGITQFGLLYLRGVIDDVEIGNYTAFDLMTRDVTKPNDWLLYFTEYNSDAGVLTFALCPLISFSDSFKIQAKEPGGAVAHPRVFYNKVVLG